MRLRDRLIAILLQLAAIANIVVIPIYFNQAEVLLLHAVFVVYLDIAFLINAILDFRLSRLAGLLFRNNHLAIVTEIVGASLQIGILGNIFLSHRGVAILLQLAAVNSIIVIPIIRKESGIHFDIALGGDVVEGSVNLNDLFLFDFTNQRPIFAKLVHIFFICGTCAQGLDTICEVATIIEIICFSIDCHKLHVTRIRCPIIRSTIIVPSSLISCMPCAFGFTGFIKLVGHAIHRVCACCCYLRVRLEIMVLSINFMPAANQFAEFCITICLHRLIIEQSGQLRLALIDAVFTEVIVIAVDQLHASQLLAILVVGESTGFIDPAFFCGADQSVSVFNLFVSISKICAGITGIIRIYIRHQTVNLLILFLLGEGVESICSQIDLVADGTLCNCIDTVLGTPISICLRSNLNSVQHTQGVRRGRVNGCSLLNPAQSQC